MPDMRRDMTEADQEALNKVATEWHETMQMLMRVCRWTEDYARAFLAVMAQQDYELVKMKDEE